MPESSVQIVVASPPALAATAAEPPRHLSPSSASLFGQCPKRWRLRYIERLPDPPGLAALVGTLAHRVLELLMGEPAAGRSVERARQLAGEAWPELAAHDDFAYHELDAAAIKAFKWQVWRAIEGLWRLEDPKDVPVAATEQRLEAEVGGVPFLGVIDRVDHHPDGVVITDYKSGRPPAPRFEEQKLDQVLLYAAAVAATSDLRPVRARLLYLGATVIEVAADGAELERAVGRLVDTWDALQAARATDTFEARTGPLCGWCPYLDRCEEGRAELVARAARGWVLPEGAPGLRLVA